MSGVPPVKKRFVVEASAQHAFEVFTEGVDRWWPRQHHIGASPLARAVIEPKLGGRWYAICEDGTECETGKVLAWDPPRRVVLAWQLTAEWKFDPNFITEVEVIFTPKGPKQTQIDLEHRNLERYGAGASDLRTAIDGEGGWGTILAAYAEAAKT
jgi:uncharacterized protein YndB with AHSA1/START domain